MTLFSNFIQTILLTKAKKASDYDQEMPQTNTCHRKEETQNAYSTRQQEHN